MTLVRLSDWLAAKKHLKSEQDAAKVPDTLRLTVQASELLQRLTRRKDR